MPAPIAGSATLVVISHGSMSAALSRALPFAAIAPSMSFAVPAKPVEKSPAVRLNEVGEIA